MARTPLLLLTLSLTLHLAATSCDWPSCNGISNVACDVGGLCMARGECQMMSHDEDFRREILHAHNTWRSYLASGNETRGGNGPAANMRALSYDVELEFTARCNVVDCEMQHDQCRSTHTFERAGQNLCWTSGHTDFSKEPVDCVKSWYEECKDTTTEQIDAFSSSGTPVGHFTQLVWAKTTHIGCARATKGVEFVLACNYGEAGNMLSDPVYARGEACSQLAGMKLNGKYPGLCGEIDEAGLTAAPLAGGGSRFSGSVLVGFMLAFVLVVGDAL